MVGWSPLHPYLAQKENKVKFQKRKKKEKKIGSINKRITIRSSVENMERKEREFFESRDEHREQCNKRKEGWSEAETTRSPRPTPITHHHLPTPSEAMPPCCLVV